MTKTIFEHISFLLRVKCSYGASGPKNNLLYLIKTATGCYMVVIQNNV